MVDMGGLWEAEGADEGDGSMIRVLMRKEARGEGGARVLAGDRQTIRWRLESDWKC